jgi:DNA-binding transcriptional LysR family regulator
VEAARRAAQPARKTFAIGFQTGHEINWLPRAMHVLRDELKNIQVTISSDTHTKASVLAAVTEDYLRRCGLEIKLDHGVDNMAMAMSLVASTRGLALMPAYAKNLLRWSVVSRPLEGEAPTIDLAVGYSKSNTSPILKLFLSRLEELRAPMPERKN